VYACDRLQHLPCHLVDYEIVSYLQAVLASMYVPGSIGECFQHLVRSIVHAIGSRGPKLIMSKRLKQSIYPALSISRSKLYCSSYYSPSNVSGSKSNSNGFFLTTSNADFETDCQSWTFLSLPPPTPFHPFPILFFSSVVSAYHTFHTPLSNALTFLTPLPNRTAVAFLNEHNSLCAKLVG
jgi:hypothetical protein